MSSNLFFARSWLVLLSFFLALTLALFFAETPSAHASPSAIITVNTLSETSSMGHCTLRDAIHAANTDLSLFGCLAGSGADIIVFNGALNGTIVLTGQLSINQPVTIDGGNKIAISGGGTQSIMAVYSPAAVVNLYNLTLQNGYNAGYHGAALYNDSTVTMNISNTKFLTNSVLGWSGGAIINYGIMNINGSTFSGNISTRASGFGGGGGAIYNPSFGGSGNLAITNTTFVSNTSNYQGGALWSDAFLTVTNSTFSGNQTGSAGGAIHTDTYSSLRVVGSTFTSNSAISPTFSVGGAIDNDYTTLVILNSTFSNNSTAKNYGGAINIFGAPNASIGNSTISNNKAGNGNDYGGGIAFGGFNLVITNSAITGNQAIGGGGIYATNNTTMTITNTTISGNTASANGGGIYSNNSPVTITLNNVTISKNSAATLHVYDSGGGVNITGTFKLKNTIIAGNSIGVGSDPDCAGTLTTLGYNLLGDNTGCSGLTNGVSFDKVGTGGSPLDAKLGTLTNLGGLTQVLPLLPGSPTSDAGNFGTCASTDQRGVARTNTILDPCDMGAFEGLGYYLDLPLIIK